MLPWQSKPSSQHLTINNRKDEELTFVATGNRSQAKEEEGEKIHSVHLREERKGGNRVGRGTGEEYSTCINNWSALEETVTVTRQRDRQKQIRPIRRFHGGV